MAPERVSAPSDLKTAPRDIHRLLLRMMIFLNRGVDPGHAWRDIGKEPSYAQFRTLIMINQIGPCTLKALSDAMGISAASASEMIERLVELGFVDRRQNLADRRCVQVEVTSAAVKGIERHEALITGRLGLLTDAIGEKSTHQWIEVFEKLEEAIGCLTAKPASQEKPSSPPPAQ